MKRSQMPKDVLGWIKNLSNVIAEVDDADGADALADLFRRFAREAQQRATALRAPQQRKDPT